AADCDSNTTCKCPIGLTQGQYCGGDIGCDSAQVYECSPNGNTCTYGNRTSCEQCGALQCPSPVVSASSSLTSPEPTFLINSSQIQNPPQPTSVNASSVSTQLAIVTNPSQIPSTDRPTSTNYETPTTTSQPSQEDPASPQKFLFIGIGSGIGGLMLVGSLIFAGIFFYKRNKSHPIPTPGNVNANGNRKKLNPIPTPGSMRDEL
ncbi:11698_t:CDS:2, partial [Dentiscutata erythropus]